MLADPALARVAASPTHWRALVLAAHRSLTRARDDLGRWQLPWPRLLGTPPWSLARALSGILDQPPYRWHGVRTRPAALGPLLAHASRERPMAVYVGSRVLPRHVLLVTGSGPDGTRLYNPATGRMHHFLPTQWPGPGNRWTRVWGVLG